MNTYRNLFLHASLFFMKLAILFLLLPNVSSAEQNWQYIVQPGDNLWNLSKKHLKSMKYWKQFVELNSIADPYNIPPGTTLKFPVEWLKSGAAVATVVDFTGDVIVVQHGRNKEVDSNVLIWGNDTILTGPESNVTLQFSDGSRILIQEESEVKIDSLESYGETGMAKTKMQLKKGRTHNRVIPKTGPASRFQIVSPSAIAAVRGTEYRLSTSVDGLSRTEVLKGVVDVDSNAERIRVKEGFGTVSSAEKGSISPVKLLSAPDLSTFPAMVRRVPFSLTIEPIDGAVDYRLQIARDEHFTSLLFDKIFPTGSMWGPDIPDGVYFLRVHGIDGKGLEGIDTIHRLVIDAHPVPPMLISPAEGDVIFEDKPAFRWSKPVGIEKFVLQLGVDETFEKPLLFEENGVSGTEYSSLSHLDTGLYFWRAASIDMKGKIGPFTDPQGFRRSPSRPDMDGSSLDKNTLTFRWRAGGPGHAFRCQLSKTSDFTDILDQVDSDEPEYGMDHYEPGDYYIRVAVIDIDGFVGPFAQPQKVVVPATPLNPLVFVLSYIFMVMIAL